MSSPHPIQQAQQLAEQGDKNAAGRLLKRQLDQNFKDTAAWELMYQLFSGERSFPDFQVRFVQKYYPQRVQSVPFCPRCHKAYPQGAQFCGYCGFGMMAGGQAVNYQAIAQAVPVSQAVPVGESKPVTQSVSTPEHVSGSERVSTSERVVVVTPDGRGAGVANPSGKSKAPLWWALGLGLFILYVLNSGVTASGESFDLGELFFWTFFSLWVSSGYVGMVWLFRRGYMTEMLGCMFMAGGAPLWFPAFFGAIILGIAYSLPLYPVRQVARG